MDGFQTRWALLAAIHRSGCKKPETTWAHRQQSEFGVQVLLLHTSIAVWHRGGYTLQQSEVPQSTIASAELQALLSGKLFEACMSVS